MSKHSFYQLDVFTDTPLHGNPLAVFPDAEGLNTATMQALAREMNLSETVFVTESEHATRLVRFFTPTAEIPLAGHPTVGTWWLLAELGQLEQPPGTSIHVTQETGAGVLPVEIEVKGRRPSKVSMTQTLPEFGTTVEDRGRLARALGGSESLIPSSPAPQVVSTALPQLMVPIGSLAELEGLPSGGTGGTLVTLLRELGTDCVMCYCHETRDAQATVHCRMFAPGLGVPEDPATGSAAGALGSYLVHNDRVNTGDGLAHVVVEQGIEIDRPSRIEVEVAVDEGVIQRVLVGGQAVTVISGEVRL
jgi:trans-2,3-dihydro-3-hydroxyanthranilate isomerase